MSHVWHHKMPMPPNAHHTAFTWLSVAAPHAPSPPPSLLPRAWLTDRQVNWEDYALSGSYPSLSHSEGITVQALGHTVKGSLYRHRVTQ